MKRSTSDNGKYPELCLNAISDEKIFSNFKSEKEYKKILEHVSFEQGAQYYEQFKNKKEIIKRMNNFKINDSLGNPTKFNYGFGTFSPTTLRYIKILSDISEFYDINDKDIIEIGGGYGGQYVTMKELITPKSYSIVDIKGPLELIGKYVKRLNKNENFHLIDGDDKTYKFKEKYDLFISNYAISECNKEIQEYYLENIIKKSEHGYVIHNQFNGYTLNEFVSTLKKLGKNVSVGPEIPRTGKNNVLLKW